MFVSVIWYISSLFDGANSRPICGVSYVMATLVGRFKWYWYLSFLCSHKRNLWEMGTSGRTAGISRYESVSLCGPTGKYIKIEVDHSSQFDSSCTRCMALLIPWRIFKHRSNKWYLSTYACALMFIILRDQFVRPFSLASPLAIHKQNNSKAQHLYLYKKVPNYGATQANITKFRHSFFYNHISRAIINIKSEVSAFPIVIICCRACVPEMFVISYSVTYCIDIPGKPGICFHCYCAVYDECK